MHLAVSSNQFLQGNKAVFSDLHSSRSLWGNTPVGTELACLGHVQDICIAQ